MELFTVEEKDTSKTFKFLEVTHEDEETLVFISGGYQSTAMIQKRNIEEYGHLFREANDFITLLSKRKQDKLYDIYARLYSYFRDFDFHDAGESKSVADFLSDLTKEIYQIIKYDDLVEYVKMNGSLKIPSDVYSTYTTDDKITQAYIDKTYLINDYIHLMSFSLGQRFMIPIWGRYTKILEKTDGKEMKDYQAFCLLKGTCMWESEAFTRAEVYIEANMDKGKSTLASMLKFLAKEEIPTYLLALTSLRKISVAPLSCGTNEEGHLMRMLHNYAVNQHKQLDARLQPDVHAKKNNNEFVDDNTSVFGQFKMKERISIGDLEINQQYISRYLKAARKIEPSVIDEHIEACVAAALAIKDYRPTETQRALAAWVTSYVIPSVVVPMFDRKHLMLTMGISQAVMWAWGYHELAILVTAKPLARDENEFRSREGRTHLSKDRIELLEIIYPWTFNLNPHVPGGDSTNVGIRGIELIAGGFNKEEWEPTCPRGLAKLHERSDVSRRIDPSHNLRDQLADLLVRLDKQI